MPLGTIIISYNFVVDKAHIFKHSMNSEFTLLFIHGLLHLKGYDHGDTMDKMEHKYLKLFNIS